MAEYVPESPTSVASSWYLPSDWSEGDIPLEVDEDVLVPYWDLLKEELFRDETDFREVWVNVEQQLRDFWHNQHLIQRD